MSITSAGSSTNLAQLRQLQQTAFKAADADGDGQLSLTEFQSIGQNVQGSGGHCGPPPMRGAGGPGGHFSGDTLSALLSTQSAGDLAGSVMKAGDADGDGKLTTDEIAKALAANAPDAVKGQGMEDKMASDIVSALDTDGDGSLSSSEISSAITKAASDESSAQASAGGVQGHHHHHHGGMHGAGEAGGSSGSFDALDTNKDGTVSAEELAAGGGASTDPTKSAADPTTDLASTFASLMSNANATADMMQKLLAQLDSALKTSSTSSTAVSGGAGVTA